MTSWVIYQPDHIISTLVSRWMPMRCLIVARAERTLSTLWIREHANTRTFPDDVSSTRLGAIARQPAHWALEFPWSKLRATAGPRIHDAKPLAPTRAPITLPLIHLFLSYLLNIHVCIYLFYTLRL